VTSEPVPSPRATAAPQPVRLQKLLADAGVASRRAAERLIAAGRVTVNGEVVRTPGTSALLERDDVRVDGVPVRAPVRRTYLLLNKPAGYTTTLSDPHAERTVRELLPRSAARVYPVGRLDRESEGLLLLTDDGELAQRLLHPRYGLEREYAVLVRGTVTAGTLAELRKGVKVEGTLVAPVSVAMEWPPAPIPHSVPGGAKWLRITVREGRKREVRRMCAAVHLGVLRLIRVRFGPLTLGDLPPGRTRPLTPEEIARL
jgi:23S rRNA pseudouridine2605 synthase